MAYSCCFGFRVSLEFQIFCKNSFITSTPALLVYSSKQASRLADRFCILQWRSNFARTDENSLRRVETKFFNEHRLQCDQMARWLIQYLAINSIINLPDSVKIMPK